jgi:hypothetical protein
VVVSGEVQTYDVSTRAQITRKPFSFLVSTVPLSRRTIQNPSGLLVKALKEFTPAPNPKTAQVGE